MSNLLVIYTGCMRSGKTRELIRTYNQWEEATANIFPDSNVCVTHSFDPHSLGGKIVSHDGEVVNNCHRFSTASHIFSVVNYRTFNLFINEVQFFDLDIIGVIEKLFKTYSNLTIHCAGLDLNCFGMPFGPMPHLLSIANIVYKLFAYCSICGLPAYRTQRLIDDPREIIPENKNNKIYEPRCIRHFDPKR